MRLTPASMPSTVWPAFFLRVQSPVPTVQIGGGVFLLVVVSPSGARGTPEWRLASTPLSWLTDALVVSSAAILYVGVYRVLETVGVVTE
ncbi:hypothetical protein NGM36_00745 [Streptomyces mutabilis]|uniref:hypothetical protein n=1 Tax=Streptomyces mutabilis TaxID=67332 RepID=UPI0022BA3B31|nr:hypothetical protein [Streptomyces mutabilis]MCZ9348353.1 hypothetical protein [Streptomyces mutabilis]